MAMYEIAHMDAAETMTVEAESPSKAKYKNYLAWSDAFNTDDFKGYIKGLIYCKKIKQSSCNNKKCLSGECNQTETCTAYVPVITNADRIRAMSDDELIEFIKNIKVRAALCKAVKNNDAFDKLCSAEWLKQPAE